MGSSEHRLSAAVLFPVLQLTARDMVPPPQVALQLPNLPTCRHMQQVLLMLGLAHIVTADLISYLPEHKVAWLRVAGLAGCWHLSWAVMSIKDTSIDGKA